MADDNDDRTVITGNTAPPRAAPDNTLPIGTRLAEFELIGLIGAGGFGIVYLAHDHSLGRRVALKEYMPAALAARGSGLHVTMRSGRNAETFEAGRRSFVNEARLLAQFDHPALVKVYRFWEDNGTAYMVMPYYEGITLKRALQEMDGPPDETWLRHLLAPLLDALEVMHGAQIYHRDIAPDNIMLLGGERPLLLDFGAARHVISDMTQALTVILKPGYAPIEQYAEMPELKQGAWTDIYALAAVVYLAIMGRTPPPAVGRLMQDKLEPLASKAAGRYSDTLLRAIDRGLAVRPEDRPQSIAEFRELLQLAPGEGHAPAMPHGTQAKARHTSPPPNDRLPEQAAETTPRKANPLALAAIGGLILAAAAGYLMQGDEAAPDDPGTGPQPSEELVRESSPPQTPPSVSASGEPPVPASAPAAEARPDEQPLAAEPMLPVAPADAPAVPLPPFSAIAEIERIYRDSDASRAVSVALDNPRVRIGVDRLNFRVRSSSPGYLYVFMVGTNAHFYKLFPNAIDADNRLRANTWLDLPRSGWRMTAGGPAGTNHFVAVVSEHPRDFGASGLVEVAPFAEFPLDQATQIATRATGRHSAFIGTPICPSLATPCSNAYGAATFKVEEVDADAR